jgi:predicted acetyltransferase
VRRSVTLRRWANVRRVGQREGEAEPARQVSDLVIHRGGHGPVEGHVLVDRVVRNWHYRCRMRELIAPTTRLHTAWLEAHAEWGPGSHEDGFGLGPSDEVDSSDGFAAWVARLADQSDPAKTIDVGKHRCTYRWIVECDRVLGAIALRYGRSDYVQWAGHIGYGIRPSARRRGLATWAVGGMLDEARALGLERLLVVCAADNVASVKTIERCGGVLEGIRDTKFGPARRYWIEL